RDQGPDHPAVRCDQFRDGLIAVVGRGRKFAAKCRFRVVDEDREVPGPLVGRKDRPVIGDEFGEQSKDEQREKDPQRPEPAPVAAMRRSGWTLERAPRRAPRCSSTSISAIWTALRAAPLRRLSATTHKLSPFGTVGSRRMRLT